ncbi:MAG: hypothetical protein E6I92_01575 [Chloroflexi bacterium]|nr:MAG: hypothetical protein E6I92_01575 [Chloroflexota bacterium]
MAEVLQEGLVEFANRFRQPPAPGVEVIQTSRYRVTLQPDYPIPGPNSASWVRAPASEADDVIREVRKIFGSRDLPFMWILDPDTEPVDFPDLLAAHGSLPEPHSPEVAVMVLGIGSPIEAPSIPGLMLHDALADAELFAQADAVNAEAFHDSARDAGPRERRRRDMLAAGNRLVLLATIAGEPAGSAGLTLCRAREVPRPRRVPGVGGGALANGPRGRSGGAVRLGRADVGADPAAPWFSEGRLAQVLPGRRSELASAN